MSHLTRYPPSNWPPSTETSRGTETKNTAQALDLSDSEEEEEMEDLIDQFAQPDSFEVSLISS